MVFMGEHWSKKKRRKKCAAHFGNDNFAVNGIILNAVHKYPGSVWKPEQECDFYMDNGDDIFLLRIINNKKNQISFSNDGRIIYIIVETLVSGEEVEVLKPIVHRVQQILRMQEIEWGKDFSYPITKGTF